MRGFFRVALGVPPVRVADVAANVTSTIALMQDAQRRGAHVVAFPELGVTAYTCRDLFEMGNFLDAAEAGVQAIAEATAGTSGLVVVGAPLRFAGRLYNTAVALADGRVIGVVPKSYLPQGKEFEERRYFQPGAKIRGATISVAGHDVPFGVDLLFGASDGTVLGIEVCEDMWVPHPPAMNHVTAGAHIIVNLSASNIIVGKAPLRRQLAGGLSERGKCAYAYVAAGPGESSTDMAFDGDAFIIELGRVHRESHRFSREPELVVSDIDIERLAHERRITPSFGDAPRDERYRFLPFTVRPAPGLVRDVTPTPFLPPKRDELDERLLDVFEIQSQGLCTRMQAIGRPKLILGVSGGLDSTQAALVCADALDALGRPRSDLVCVTMPGLGTTTGTKRDAKDLVTALGGTLIEIGIGEATHLLLQHTQHPAAAGTQDATELVAALQADRRLGDVTVENVQARMRTLVLMTLANQHGGIVVGTGDLSEKALGFSTYAGDHIAMYDVNASVPKTLIQHLIRFVGARCTERWSEGDADLLKATLGRIVETPISPELLPPDKDGAITQKTESVIGPYVLHDFYLYHFIRHGAAGTRLLDLAQVAFAGRFSFDELKKWLRLFIRRFFAQQFKRSATADAPKVGSVSLSPRGDWRMPSDAKADVWMAAIDAYTPEAPPPGPSPASGEG